MPLGQRGVERLLAAQNIWVSTVRPDGRPHLTPVWFSYLDEKLYICIDPDSVKACNLKVNPHITLALEDGQHPLICEGKASPVQKPYLEEVRSEFRRKYEWEIETDSRYNFLVEIEPQKWLTW